ncbi:MAG: carboxymuconolactone decarboxylase family protein [Emcibacteraceae bacterium]|nr:carboxymuconolactone decarboxylase family protein [Emcibacteraceae bacterium]
MSHLTPLKREDLPQLESTFKKTEQFLGFLPNDVLTMARMPEATEAFMEFCISIYTNSTLPAPLLHLVGLVSSAAAGCRYCTAHTANKAAEDGVAEEKVAAVWEYETSPLFSGAERVALKFANDSSQVPTKVTSEHFDALREHYSEDEITQLLMVICQFGFWNRWNDTVATRLEYTPSKIAAKVLDKKNWELGKHADKP